MTQIGSLNVCVRDLLFKPFVVYRTDKLLDRVSHSIGYILA